MKIHEIRLGEAMTEEMVSVARFLRKEETC